MNTITHALIGWDIAAVTTQSKRERIAVALAGILPDLDGFGAPVEIVTHGHIPLYSLIHHTFGHNLWASFIIAVIVWFVSRRKIRPALLAFLMVHLHFLCDIAGSKGPDGSIWGITYFWPFSNWEIAWSHQWALNAWPNILITILALIWMFYYAIKHGVSIVEFFSARGNAIFVETLRARFGRPGEKKEVEQSGPDR